MTDRRNESCLLITFIDEDVLTFLCVVCVCNCVLISRFVQYDDGIHTSYMGDAPPSMYDPHVAHRPLQNIAHHSPHMNHGMHQYHTGNHVAAVANHVMGPVTDVHKRDKDAIYG